MKQPAGESEVSNFTLTQLMIQHDVTLALCYDDTQSTFTRFYFDNLNLKRFAYILLI